MNRGFTLFEVAISLAILAMGVTVMMTLIPIGLRTQEAARSRLLASAQAVNMIEVFNNMGFIERGPSGIETRTAAEPWHSPAGHRGMSHDLEDKVATIFGGMAPLPLTIARRIDTPDDELRRILDQGGYVYYAKPGMPGGFAVNTIATTMLDPPHEAGKLIVGVVGLAQQNAVSAFAPKAWPYYSDVSAPPDWDTFSSGDSALDEQYFVRAMYFTTATAIPKSTNWGRSRNVDPAHPDPADPDHFLPNPDLTRNEFLAGFESYGLFDSQDWVGNMATRNPTPTPEMAKRFFACAWWYAHRILARTGGTSSPLAAALGGDIPAYDPALPGGRPGENTNPRLHAAVDAMIVDKANTAKYVAALRAVAFAGMCLTRHYTAAQFASIDAGPPADVTSAYPGLYPGVYVPPYRIDAAPMSGWPVPYLSAPAITASIALPPDVPAQVVTADSTPPAYITLARLTSWNEAMMHTLMRYCASYPYDWAMRRPANRPIMMDVPLVQYDLFPTGSYATSASRSGDLWLDLTIDPTTGSSRGYTSASGSFPWFSGTIAGSTVTARQWRWITPQVVPRIGRNHTNALMMDSGASSPWGDPAHFNLTAPFSPTERCRQIVVWSVDWQSYEDFETAPGAPVDASRYPMVRISANSAQARRLPSRNGGVDTLWASQESNIVAMMNKFGPGDAERPSFRNPEKLMLFTRDVSAFPTGRPMIDWIQDVDTIGQTTGYSFTDPGYGVNVNTALDSNHIQDLGNLPNFRGQDPKQVFSGLYGADRNNNTTLERGRTPPTVRLRATEVARFNFYDPRLPQSLR